MFNPGLFLFRMKTLINKIKDAFAAGLPGREAQYQMAHAFRGAYPTKPEDARKAGVLILLFPKEDQWHLVFIQRPGKNPNDHHSGQISFPGGKLENNDPDIQYTALRETEEEVGIDKNKIAVIGQLTDLYIPVSNFLVTPTVGFTDSIPHWRPQPEEVAGIIEHPLHELRNVANKKITSIKVSPNLRLQQVPYFDLNGKILWGATAMMLNEFLEMKW